MPTLRTSLGSPFGRKARIAIISLGLAERVRVTAAATTDQHDPIHALNPLRKVPVLVTDDNVAVFDSPVILEYLDWLAGGGRILPMEPQARFSALTLQALADGMTDALVLIRYEDRWRPDIQHSEPWLAHQQKKVNGALDALEQSLPPDDGWDVGQIAVACALGFCDRAAAADWRDSRPNLAAWLNDFSRRCPAFEQTKP